MPLAGVNRRYVSEKSTGLKTGDYIRRAVSGRKNETAPQKICGAAGSLYGIG
jgi:hypothetical protein